MSDGASAATGAARATRVSAVVRAVCAAAVRESGAAGIIVLQDWTPEGELVYEWLVAELGEDRVWREAARPDNVEAAGSREAGPAIGFDAPLLAHPANKTALLLGGRPPRVDLLPLGDLWASQVEQLAGRWSAPAAVEEAARQAGGITALDSALLRLVEERRSPEDAVQNLPAGAGERVVALYERGRYGRLRQRVVPKLTARTLGIDLFD